MASQPPIMSILGEDSQRSQGQDAQSMNITAGRAVTDTITSTLGPSGMNKMLVSDAGLVTVSNNGAEILNKLDVEHPAANLVIEVANAQQTEIGDGTTTAAILAGELLQGAEDLIEKDVHATSIAAGYLEAAVRARHHLEDMAVSVDPEDTDVLRNVAKTAMTAKGPGVPVNYLVDLVVEAVRQVSDELGTDIENIKVDAVEGKSIRDSQLVDGVTVHKEPLRDQMPTHYTDARIALIDDDIDVREGNTDINVNLTDPEQMEQFQDRELSELRTFVDGLVDTGVDVVFCTGTVDDLAQRWFVDNGILAFRRIRDHDIWFLSRATGADVVPKIDEFTSENLGSAGLIEHQDFGEEVSDYRMFVRGCSSPKSVTILLRGSTEAVVEDLENSIEDALNACQAVIDNPAVLPGGGAAEMEIALQLSDFASTVSGRKQLAISEFADSMTVIPKILAENAGADPIDTVTELRSRHENSELNVGYSVSDGVTDVWKEGVVEPLDIKSRAIASAQEAAELLIRIDDVIAADELVVDDEDDAGDGLGL